MAERFEFAFDLAEQQAGAIVLTKNVYSIGWKLALYARTLLPFGVAVMISLWLSNAGHPKIALPMLIISGIVFLLFFPRYIQRACMKKYQESTGASDYQGQPVTFEASKRGVVWTCPNCRIEMDWSAIQSILETPNSLVFASGAVGYLLPKDQFNDAAHLNTFKQECENYIFAAKT